MELKETLTVIESKKINPETRAEAILELLTNKHPRKAYPVIIDTLIEALSDTSIINSDELCEKSRKILSDDEFFITEIRWVAAFVLTKLWPRPLEQIREALASSCSKTAVACACIYKDIDFKEGAKDLLPALKHGEPIIEHIFRTLSKNNYIKFLIEGMAFFEPRVRTNCIKMIMREKKKHVVKKFIQALSDPEYRVRCEAAWYLGKNRVKQAIPHLLNLLYDKKPQVVVDALFALSMIEDDSAVNPIISFLKNNKNLSKEVKITAKLTIEALIRKPFDIETI